MRYSGVNNLPPCASPESDGVGPPRGFEKVDLSSLSSDQLNQLQELGSRPAETKSQMHRKSPVQVSDEESEDEPIEVPEFIMEDKESEDSEF